MKFAASYLPISSKLFTALNLLLIGAMLLSPVGSVLAQTQTPTETPAAAQGTPGAAADPTETPAAETPVPADAANLVFTVPAGWDGAVVFSKTVRTHTQDEFVTGDQVYLDFAVTNSGTQPSAPFSICLKIDEVEVKCWDSAGLDPNTPWIVQDEALESIQQAGLHHYEMLIDSANSAPETSESDNSLSLEINWTEPAALEPSTGGSPLVNDVRVADVPAKVVSEGGIDSNYPGYYDRSTYMTGSVAVGIILPESTWTDTENWTIEEQDQVIAEIQEGLSRWAAWSNSQGVDANVSFVYDVHRSVSVDMEPINTYSSTDYNWINKAMTSMGYPKVTTSGYENVRNYLADLAAAKNTQWAFAIFVVDSSADADGKFLDGNFAYAYLNGPLMVMTYDNDGWGITNMDRVAQHETAHIFGAGDNYYQEGYGGCTSTTDPYGYLAIPNSNCAYQNPSADTDVLMNNNNPDRVHWTTLQQVGWRDSDSDRIPDVIDTTPAFSLDALADDLTIKGVIYDQPYPHNDGTYPWDIAINTIVSADFRVDGGAWQPVTFLTSPIGSDQVQISFNVGSLTVGTHTVEVRATNSVGNSSSVSQNYNYPSTVPPNDAPVNAISLPLATTFEQKTYWGTASTAEPVSVCNTADTNRVWFKTTVSSNQNYRISVYGSDYSPSISVFKMPAEGSKKISCTETAASVESTSQLTFTSDASQNYLIGISSKDVGGNLSIRIDPQPCYEGDFCGTAVGATGHVINFPLVMITDPNGSWLYGSTNGDYSGYFMAYLDGYPAVGYVAVTSGANNLVVTQNLSLPGIFTASGIGNPKMTIALKDAAGTIIPAESISVASTKYGLGGYVGASTASAPLDLYAPPGTYSISASSNTSRLMVHQPAVTLTSSTIPGSLLLDASVFPKETFTVLLDGVTEGRLYLFGPDYYGHSFDVSHGQQLTLAMPQSLVFPGFYFDYSTIDPADSATWYYEVSTPYLQFQGGTAQDLHFGGLITFNPVVINDPVRRDEGSAKIVSNIMDAYGNLLMMVDSSDRVGNMSAGAGVSAVSFDGSTAPTASDGKPLYLPADETAGIQADYVFTGSYVPFYQAKHSVHTELSLFNYPALSSPAATGYLNFGSPMYSGLWNLRSGMQLGPFGGGLKYVDSTFTVYDVSPVTGDLFSDPQLISAVPYSASINTSGNTHSADDPLLPGINTRGYATTWFKYIPPNDGYLTIDTAGSNYDTVLAVWQGTQGALTNRAINDDQCNETVCDRTSKVEISVTAGQPYYIEVAQYVAESDENSAIQSLDAKAAGGGGISIQQIGGTLNISASLRSCYSLTVSANPAGGGTITKSVQPNCLGTKYSEGTEITLQANPAASYGFWKWSNEQMLNPYTFTITGNTSLQAMFIAVPGTPVLSSPADKSLVFHDTVLLKWAQTSPVSDRFLVIVASDPAFSSVVDQSITTAVSYTPAGLEPNKTYYWTVRGISKIDQYSLWSAVRSFRTAVLTPVLTAPESGAQHTNRPLFDWQDVPGATGYTLQISKNSAFSAIVTTGSPAGSSYTPTTNLPAGVNLYWRVQAKAVNGPSRWSETRTFTVPATLPIPVLSSPAGGALTTSYTPKLDWADIVVPLGAKPLAFYRLQLSTDAAFTAVSEFNPVKSQWTVGVDGGTALDPNSVYYWRVSAQDTTGNYSGWSAVRSLRTAVLPPVLASPDEGFQPLFLRPTVTWEAVAGASGYALQVSRNSTFTSLVGTYTTSGNAAVEYTPVADWPSNTTLYWRVQAKAANGPSLWSAVRTLRMPATPSVPLLLSPANGGMVTADTVTLDWGDSVIPAGGAAFERYQLLVGTDPAFSEGSLLVDPAAVITISNSPITSGLTPNTLYYWKVRAFNQAGEYSSWSVQRSFKTAVLPPELLSPGTGMLNTNRPLFDWSDVASATGYFIQISKNSSFTSLAASATVGSSSYTPTVNLPTGITLYWRVRANAAYGPSRYSEVRTFQVPLAPLIPSPVSPADNALATSYTPTLDWGEVTVPVGGAALKRYEVQVSSDKNFSGAVDVDAYQSKYTLVDPLMPNTLYYWRVRTVDANENVSGWSAARRLRAAILPPALTSPVSGTTALELRPKFDWEDVPGASGYTIQVSKNSAFTLLVGSYATSAAQSEYTPSANLPANIPLYWRVQTKAANGPSLWSAAWTVRSPNPPSVPLLVSPANNALVTTKSPKLEWSDSIVPAGTTFLRYQLQVAMQSSFAETLIDQNIGGSVNSGYSIKLILLNNTTYYWRVRSFNDLGQFSAWSVVRSFKVGAGDTLRVNAGTFPSTLDPQKAWGSAENAHLKLIYEGLTRLDENLDTIPAAAASWAYNADATEITFTLRSNLKYSDGTLLNAKRFEYAILRAVDPRIEAPYGSLLNVIAGAQTYRTLDLASTPPSQLTYYRSQVMVKAYDTGGKLCTSYTQANCLVLKIGFTEPAAYFHTLTSMMMMYPVREDKITTFGSSWWKTAANQVGNGPFKAATLNVSGKSTFVPNPYYRDGAAKYNVAYSYLASADALTAYRSGSLDVVPVTAVNAAEVQSDPVLSAETAVHSGSCTFALMFDQQKAPFNDPKVRQAFAYAFDRQKWVNEELGGLGSKALTWIPQGFPGYDAAETRWDYNPSAADQALADSSYGSAAALPAITATYVNTADNQADWTWIHDQVLSELGVEILLNPVDEATYDELTANPETSPQIYLLGWCADFTDPQNWLAPFKTSGGIADLLQYSNPMLDALLEQAQATADPAARLNLYSQAQTMILGDLPVIPLWNNVNASLVKPRVKDFVSTPMDDAWPGDLKPLTIRLE